MENTTPIKACPSCGSSDFLLTESYSYKMSINQEDGSLYSTSLPDGGIDEIVCADCGEELSESDFSAINF